MTVERHLERKGDGIVVTLELSADVRGPAEVDLVDEFPPGLPVEQAGFNIDHEPDDGEVSLEGVELHHAIEATTETVVYAIRLSEAADDVAFDPPTIRDVTLPGIPEPDVPAGDGSGEGGDPAAGEEAADDPVDGGADQGAAHESEETAGGSPDPDPSSAGSGLPEGLSLEEDDDGATDASPEEPAGPEPGATDSGPSLDGLAADDDPIESALEQAEVDDAGQGGGPGVDAATGDPAGDGGTPTENPPTADGGGGTRGDGPTGGRGMTDGDATRGDASPETGVSRSVKLRLDRLNARVEEFAAYAEALEGIIERHGTAPEILDDIEADLAEADERLESVREEVRSLESEHAADLSAVRDDVDSLESRLETARGDLESDVADVRAEVDAVGDLEGTVQDVAAEVDALGDRVADHEADVEDLGETVDRVSREISEVSRNVEAMRSEMEGLQDDVDRLLRFREILSDVFGGPVRRATEGGGSPFEDQGDGSRADADRSRSDDRDHPDDRSREGGHSSSPAGPSD